MHTSTIIEKVIQRDKKQVIVKVEFTNDQGSFIEDFAFPFTVTEEDVKKRIKYFITKFEDIQTNINTVVPDGEVDLTTVVDVTPDTAKDEWFRDFYRMQNVQKLVDLGIFPNDQAQIVALRDKLKTGFKVAYINEM